MQILSLEIPPGSDLDEASLCAAHDLSRTPLREVLQRLAGEGYVSLSPNRGAKVASMDLARMRTFFQTAPLVYASIARMAAERAEKAQVNALKGIQQRFRAATAAGEAGEAALLNHRLHGAIGEMAQNPYLEAALGRMLIDHTRLSQTFYRPASEADRELVSTASDQHDEMIVAFEDRDAEAAVDVTLRHWDLSRGQLERYVRPDPLPFDMESLTDAV
ncbi:MAG: GntR family transcriptional regulator [Pseudomonadota bacterium]